MDRWSVTKIITIVIIKNGEAKIMCNTRSKKNRMLELFYRAMCGENISVKKLAEEYGVSTKSISRDISEIKNFLSENRDLVGNTEFRYTSNSKSYYLELDSFLLNKELFAIIKMMIGCRAFNKMEIIDIITKLKRFTSPKDRSVLENFIRKEIYHYNEVHHDCKSVIDNLWQLIRCIDEKKEITVSYYKMSRELVERKLIPVAITFSDYYFYLIASKSDDEQKHAVYFRVDRIVKMVEHRKHYGLNEVYEFDEGELREKIQFMFPGRNRKIRFEFTGPSVQAILDKIPTAKVVDKNGKASIIEAETFGTGVNMFLLAQGSYVKALAPQEFVDEMREEIEKMMNLYKEK